VISVHAAVAAAGVDPYALQETLAAGEPASIYDLAKAFEDAGTEAGAAYRQASAAHAQVGGAYLNNATAVLDVDGQNHQAWQLLGQGGEHMNSTAALLRRAGSALESATAGGAAALRRMEEDLGFLQQAWNAHVQRTQGVVTEADRQQFLASAVRIVKTGATQVQAEIDTYDAVLTSGAGELSVLGYAPANSPDDPGQPGGARYTIGDPTRPEIRFDDDFVYDPNASATFDDYVSWNEWGLRMRGARVLRPGLDDSLDLYAHYRDGTGTPMTVDYEEGYREDANIRRAVDGEIAEARQWAERIHGESGRTSFSMTGDASTVPDSLYPDTENWQKTLGGYTVWGSGDVTIDGNRATMTVTVHAEDRYNFDRGKADVATGVADAENGRFAELGWAKSFDTSGAVTRTISWELGSSAPPEVVDEGDVDRNPGREDRVDEQRSGR
jgi:hypothetical protein